MNPKLSGGDRIHDDENLVQAGMAQRSMLSLPSAGFILVSSSTTLSASNSIVISRAIDLETEPL